MRQSAADKPQPAAGVQPLTVTAVCLTLLTVVFWGGSPVAVRYSLDALPPVAVAAVRFAMAAVFMLLWCRLEGSLLRLRPDQHRPVLIAGLLLFFQIATFNWGLEHSNSSHGTLFINTFVFWVAAIEHFITGSHRLTPVKVAGLMIAACGVVIILTATGQLGSAVSQQRDMPTLKGDLILTLSAVLLGIKIVYTKHALKVIEPGKLIFWHDIVGVCCFTLWSLAFEQADFTRVDWPAGLGLLYQGIVVAGLCFAIQAFLLRRHAASQITVFSFATPVFGILFGVLLRGDQLSPWLFVSGLCVTVGILIVTVTPALQSGPFKSRPESEPSSG